MDKSQQLGYVTLQLLYIHNLVICIEPFTGDVDVALPTPNPSTNQEMKAFFAYNSSIPSMKVTSMSWQTLMLDVDSTKIKDIHVLAMKVTVFHGKD